MNYYQEFKELYYKEIEHSDRINSKIPTIITFLTILATAEGVSPILCKLEIGIK